MLAAFGTLKFILQHPLNRKRPLAALCRFLRWQLGSRLLPGAVAVPFVGRTRLLATPGMTGATGNIYCGLHEFNDMGFVLHALRPQDLFVDVGANIGSYTIMAAGACGASVVSIEPIPPTFAHLMDNIRLNDLGSLVTARCIGLGACPGTLRFSETLDTVNHALSAQEGQVSAGLSVPVETMDGVLAGLVPTIIKIDVEGFETEVIRGARKTLNAGALLAVLMEHSWGGNRYGFDETRLHAEMLELGFAPFNYDPLARNLSPMKKRDTEPGNILYVRDVQALRERVKAAPRYTIHGTCL